MIVALPGFFSYLFPHPFAAFLLNTNLDTTRKWAADWLVDVNPTKTISLLITRKLQTLLNPPFERNSVTLNETPNHKYLGITFSSSCTWSDHTNNSTKTAWKRLSRILALTFT